MAERRQLPSDPGEGCGADVGAAHADVGATHALPHDPGSEAEGGQGNSRKRPRLDYVHRGSHRDGCGAVPPALQEVLRNMREALLQPLPIAAATQFLSNKEKRKRKRGVVSVATFLHSILLSSAERCDQCHAHAIEQLLGKWTGMSAFTLQAQFRRLRARGGAARPCQGTGGRPRQKSPSAERSASADRSASAEEKSACDFLDAFGLLDDTGARSANDEDTRDGMAYDSRSVGLRLGALVARVYTDPRLSATSFTSFAAFLDSQAPGSIGETNHGSKFFNGVSKCMVSQLRLCTALEHWARVPALAIPSDFARIVDGYTVDNEPCQILVHLVTSADGGLEWVLIDIVPNARAQDSGEETMDAERYLEMIQ